MKRKCLTIPIYDCSVDVVVTKKFEEAVKEAGWSYDCSGVDAITLHYPDNPSNFAVLFRKGSTSPGHVAHEATHLVIKIMKAFEIKFDFDNQEPIAYLMGYVVDGLHQIIYDHG